jgi:membrane-associated phospholipid phosphatase
LAGRLGALHPAVVFLVVMLAGLAVVAGLSIGLGYLVTRVVEPAWGIGAADERVIVWFASHRTPPRTEASLVGSIVAGGVVLPIVVGSMAIVCAVLRKWRLMAFAVFVLGVESAAYRATTLVIHSHRPRVVRLEHLPVNASYPSGHTAASIAVYSGLALLLTSRFTSRLFRAFAWTIAVAITAFVAASRMYRGMHHPLDIAGGVFVGIAALIVLVFACRTAGAAAESREPRRAGSG